MPLAALAVSLALSAPPAPFDPAPFNHVLVISVDGLRSDCLEAPSIELLPNFARLLAGPHTLDARTDSQVTVTLPNQVSTITGRPVFGPYGHNWTHNSDPPDIQRGGTLHINKGAYITSMFDVAHDAGVMTTCHVSKAKFWLLQQSYGWSTGAPDTTGEDNGLAKIDVTIHRGGTGIDQTAEECRQHDEAESGHDSGPLRRCDGCHDWTITQQVVPVPSPQARP